jgi:hypothetical protein
MLREAARAKRQRQAGKMEAARAQAVEEEQQKLRHEEGEQEGDQRLGEGPAGMEQSGNAGAGRVAEEAPQVEDSPGGVGEGDGAEESEMEDKATYELNKDHQHKGPKERLKSLGAHVVTLALEVIDPAADSLAAIERQVARDAARVPALEHDLPWLKREVQVA